jgi:hypothetical protein
MYAVSGVSAKLPLASRSHARFLGIEVRYRNDRSGQSLLLTVELPDFDNCAILRHCDIYACEGDRLSENGRTGCARHNANLCAP